MVFRIGDALLKGLPKMPARCYFIDDIIADLADARAEIDRLKKEIVEREEFYRQMEYERDDARNI